MGQDNEMMRKGPWTEHEDFQLVFYVRMFGDRRWDFIANVSGLKVAGVKKKANYRSLGCKFFCQGKYYGNNFIFICKNILTFSSLYTPKKYFGDYFLFRFLILRFKTNRKKLPIEMG